MATLSDDMPDERETHRTAVVFIHGQGEQRPMESVRELARTVWSGDPSLSESNKGPLRLWSTPDTESNIFELRRLSTEGVNSGEYTEASGHDRNRFDFYEFYWAHRMAGTKLVHVLLWFIALIRKPHRETPGRLRPLRHVLTRFSELNSLFAAAFAVLTMALILRFDFGDTAAKPGFWDSLETFRDTLAGFSLDQQVVGTWAAAARVYEAFGPMAALWLNAFLAVIVLPILALYFVLSSRIDFGDEQPVDGASAPSAHQPEGAQRFWRTVGIVVGVAMSQLFIFLMIGSMSPTFELRDVPVLIGGIVVLVVVLTEANHPGRSMVFVALAAAILVAFAPVDDGRMLAALTVGALGSLWLAVRMHFTSLIVVTTLVTAAAIFARTGMSAPPFDYYAGQEAMQAAAQASPVFNAEFSKDAPGFVPLAWAYFFFFALGYPFLLISAARGFAGRLFWLALTVAVAAVCAITAANVSSLGDFIANGSVYSPWSSPYFRPIDEADTTAAHIIHLQFWLTLVVVLGAGSILVFLVVANRAFLSPVMGDSARYLRPTPENIASRQNIRQAGVDLLEKLHASGRYERIIVVAHSLGSVVGYDILTHFWGRRCARLHLGHPAEQAMQRVEDAALWLVGPDGHGRKITRAYYEISKMLNRDRGLAIPKLRLDELFLVEGDKEARHHEAIHRVRSLYCDRASKMLAGAAGNAKPYAAGASGQTIRARYARLSNILKAGAGGYGQAAAEFAAIAEHYSRAKRGPGKAMFEDASRLASTFREAAAAHESFRAAQARYAETIARARMPNHGHPEKPDQPVWLISDFITLGSPLNYGPYLLSRSASQFAIAKRDREFPICPPYMEVEPPREERSVRDRFRFSYKQADPRSTSAPYGPNHGSVFGPVRWTNLFFDTRHVVLGDIISGPLWRHFDIGVHDVMLEPEVMAKLFTHNEYWKSDLDTKTLKARSAAAANANDPVTFLSFLPRKSRKRRRKDRGEEDRLPQHIAALRMALGLTRNNPQR